MRCILQLKCSHVRFPLPRFKQRSVPWFRVTLLSHQIRFCSSSSHEETHLHKADHKETLPSSDSHYSNPYVAKLKKHELFHGDFEEIFHDESPDTSIKEIDEEDPYKYHGYKGEIPKTIQGKRVFTREEVAQHRSPTDCWIVIHGKVYNVTKWMNEHPGGKDVIFQHAGGDATLNFDFVPHSYQAHDMLKKLHIGYVLEKPRFRGVEKIKLLFDYYQLPPETPEKEPQKK